MVTSHPLPLSTKNVTGGQAGYRFQARVQGSLFSIILWNPVALEGGPVPTYFGSHIHPCEVDYLYGRD